MYITLIIYVITTYIYVYKFQNKKKNLTSSILIIFCYKHNFSMHDFVLIFLKFPNIVYYYLVIIVVKCLNIHKINFNKIKPYTTENNKLNFYIFIWPLRLNNVNILLYKAIFLSIKYQPNICSGVAPYVFFFVYGLVY